MNYCKRYFCILIIIIFIVTPFNIIKPIKEKEINNTAIQQASSNAKIRIISNGSSIKIVAENGKDVKIITRETLYSKLSYNDVWSLVRFIRGEPPKDELLRKIKQLGIENLNQTIAKEILKTMALLKPRDSVFVTRYGIINLRNSYAKMEHWSVPLEKVDKDRDKISDSLKIILGQKIEVIVAAADRNLESAINIFRQLGGEVIAVYPSIYAFRGLILGDKIRILARMNEIGFIEKAPESGDIITNLKVSVPQIRVGTNDYKYYPPSQYPRYSSTPWALGYTGTSDLTIAIIDSGIDAHHPELYGYGEKITFKTNLIENVDLPGNEGDWYNDTVNLMADNEYYVSISWDDINYDYDLYIFPPNENSIPYTQSSTRNNQFEHIYFEANETGTWKIAIKLRTSTARPSLGANGKLVVKNLTITFSDGKVIGWRDFTHENKTSPYDGYGHGTFVASIVAGEGNDSNLTYQGVAYSAKIVGIRIMNSSGKLDADLFGVFEWLLKAIDDYNISVVLAAWTLDYVSATLDEYVAKIVEHKALFVTAVGNAGNGGNIYSPATSDYAIVVGAVNDKNQLASYSTSNSSTYTKPDITAPGGSGIGTSSYTFDNSDENKDNKTGMIGAADSNNASWEFATPALNDYTDLNGTSLAAAHVAGVLNLIFDALGDYSRWSNN